jgi:excinuclease UvrABC nuclease subunit
MRCNVCRPCFQLRLEFIRAREEGRISAEEFKLVQDTMTGAVVAGKAAGVMREMMGLGDAAREGME